MNRRLAVFWFAIELFGHVCVHGEVKVIAPAGYLPGVPFLARVEFRRGGERQWDLWDAEAVLSSDNSGVVLSTNRLPLRNGLGTALLTISGNGDFNLRAEVNGEAAVRAVRNREFDPIMTAGGVLSGNANWSGIVKVGSTVTVPAGQILTVQPDTMVLLDGALAGTSGINLIVRGAIRALGTEEAPVVITCGDATLNWGQIRHERSEASLYRYTFVSCAGRAPTEGHTGTAPAFHSDNSNLEFQSSVVSDLYAGATAIGKVMMASGGDVKFNDCVLTRARMGPEIANTGLVLTNSYILEMRGPDDADGLYLHDAGARALIVSHSVIAGGDDDGIDTLDSNVQVEGSIIRDWHKPDEDAKGVSCFNGDVSLRRCLLANCLAGVSMKSSGPLGVLRLDHCTISALDRGVAAAAKVNASAGNIQIYLTNSIIQATDPFYSDFGPEKFVSVNYSLAGEGWPGVGNLTGDPLWVSPETGDFHLQGSSPAIDAGDPAAPGDPDGSRTDIGFYARSAAASLVINEIMYHPASENPLDEYIELFNRGGSPVNLDGYRFTKGIDFTFPAVTVAPGDYLVIAADLKTFRAKNPGISNVIGNWRGQLSNGRETITLQDTTGARVASVRYGDSGDWAQRQRGALDHGHRGWIWNAPHDGAGSSAELVNPQLTGENGENWASSSIPGGTPGRVNSVQQDNVAPLILNVTHFPIVPKSTNAVVLGAKIVDETTSGISVEVHYRVDALTPPEFTTIVMRDDGHEGDALAGDGIYTTILPAQTNDSIVEFYVSAQDASGLRRTWPAPAVAAADGSGPSGQVVNALYQVDDTAYEGTQPFYKIVVTALENEELQSIDNNVNGAANSDAAMNATFLSFDPAGTEVRYGVGVRNRGHGTRTAKPNNFRVDFRSDHDWKGVVALNLNAQFSWLQVLGSAINLRSGVAGAYSRAAQLRVNNSNLVSTGPIDRTYGSYAANEEINSDWAERHFPNDDNGNLYRALRDLNPSDLDYRTLEAYPTLFGAENKDSYTNTWFKTSNTSEDDWSDLIGMLRVFGPNGTTPFTPENLGKVIDIPQWLRHLASMNLLGNSETGLNSGYNDDYFMYRGQADPRFVLLFYDQDQILGFNKGFPADSPLFSAASSSPTQRSGAAFGRFLHYPLFEALYYTELKELSETSFSAPVYNALVEETLGDFVPQSVRDELKAWMAARRAYVLSQLPAGTATKLPVALVSGTPRSPTPGTSAELRVSGEGLTQYRYRLNGTDFGPDLPIGRVIALSNLPAGVMTVSVIGGNAAGVYQVESDATTVQWLVNPALPAVRLNEVLADRSGNAPDQVELYNDGPLPVDLTGLRLTDDLTKPAKFTFPATMLASGAYVVLDENQLGFALHAAGESLYLLESVTRGGAVLDSVSFGPQLTDFSIGRIGAAGEWRLGRPSLGAPNGVEPVGTTGSIKINEWSTLGEGASGGDFVELYNPDALPVDAGSLYLTDEPIGDSRKMQIPAASFIPSHGFAVFANGNLSGAAHLSFSLAGEQGQVALLDSTGGVIDQVVYGPQQPGITSGRCPDGASEIRFQETGTPGAANECTPTIAPERVPLLSHGDVWQFESAEDPGSAWREAGFNAGIWNNGEAPLGFESDPVPVPLRTVITNSGAITYYFRHEFVVDAATIPGVASLELMHWIDDGAVFYLNGAELGRFNMPAQSSGSTFASSTIETGFESLAVPGSALRSGTNVFAVEVHQATRASTDLVFGLTLDALMKIPTGTQESAIINEVLANNTAIADPTGRVSDWVEIYNMATNTVDLSGMTLSDSTDQPARWTFPPGSTLPAKGFRTIRFDPAAPASATNTGFGLKHTGGGVYLFKGGAAGGLQSSVNYGLQAADWSIGRVPDGSGAWKLNKPTLGGANELAATGDPRLLRINEWLADPATGEDWFEIFNSSSDPVDLSGLNLSDTLSSPLKDAIAPLSYIGVGLGAFQIFVADGNAAGGADHVSFKLSSGGEAIVLSTRDGALIDPVSFAAQIKGVSEGRLPDGSATIVPFPNAASPGRSNALAPADRDSDGLPDDYEVAHGFDPINPGDAALDSDGDGLTNLQEFEAGTDPRDRKDALRLTASIALDGRVLLRVPVVAGRTYSVLYAEALAGGAWKRLLDLDHIAGTGVQEVSDSSGSRARFYEVISPRLP